MDKGVIIALSKSLGYRNILVQLAREPFILSWGTASLHHAKSAAQTNWEN